MARHHGLVLLDNQVSAQRRGARPSTVSAMAQDLVAVLLPVCLATPGGMGARRAPHDTGDPPARPPN
jgi:hypothetical protein